MLRNTSAQLFRKYAIYPNVHSVAVLLIEDHYADLTDITVDTEFTGHENTILVLLLGWLRKEDIEIAQDVFTFAEIGKSSHVHDAAIKVYRGKVSPNKVITCSDLSRLLKRGK